MHLPPSMGDVETVSRTGNRMLFLPKISALRCMVALTVVQGKCHLAGLACCCHCGSTLHVTSFIPTLVNSHVGRKLCSSPS